MIGLYLATLTPAQEDAVLTERLAHAPRVVREDGCRCLIGVTEDWRRCPAGRVYVAPSSMTICHVYPRNEQAMRMRDGSPFEDVGIRFDVACKRFGEDRVNSAIRNRILRNKAARELADVRQAVSV